LSGAIQFGGEFSITAEITRRREREIKNLSVLCGLCGKFLPDEKYLPPILNHTQFVWGN
jgi:hypothetical protein